MDLLLQTHWLSFDLHYKQLKKKYLYCTLPFKFKPLGPNETEAAILAKHDVKQGLSWINYKHLKIAHLRALRHWKSTSLLVYAEIEDLLEQKNKLVLRKIQSAGIPCAIVCAKSVFKSHNNPHNTLKITTCMDLIADHYQLCTARLKHLNQLGVAYALLKGRLASPHNLTPAQVHSLFGILVSPKFKHSKTNEKRKSTTVQ